MAAKAEVWSLPQRSAIALVCLLFVGCAASRPGTVATGLDLRPEAPAHVPVVEVSSAEMVPYADLDVTWVRVTDAEIYHTGGLFYCYCEGNWFFAHTLGGTWTFVEMSRVPSDLFRARGAERPTLVRAASKPAEPLPGPSLKR